MQARLRRARQAVNLRAGSVRSELFALRRSLAGMANNVNQIARAANTDGRAPVGTAVALRSIVGAVEKIDATIDRVAAS